jgi:hypothetical protein
MRRLLFVFVVIAMLAIPTSSAFAAPRPEQPIYAGQLYLGEIVLVSVGGVFAPFERADAWVTRPAAVYPTVWPLVNPPVGTGAPPWWVTAGASQTRRMSYAEEPNLVANEFGIWNAVFMLPRDEVWYPCSFPLKWKCNFEIAPGVWELHSPALVVYDASIPAFLQYWPWIDVFGPAADPADTISPLWLDVLNYGPVIVGQGFDIEIVGYEWKWSDIP